MVRYFIILGLTLFSLFSCSDDAFETTPSTGELSFSKDTVFLDTVFTNISSSTRTFKVYNRSNKHIRIPGIRLGRGDQSFYRLNVNGQPGKSFQEVDILPKDSIYVFVEATIDYAQVSDPLYTDEVIFDGGDKEQEVKLITLVQDAYFLFPERNAQGISEKIVVGVDDQGEDIAVEGFYLDGDVIWGNDKPYVIFGYAGVRQGNSLTIQKGARIHFHDQSGLLVEKEGSLRINGTLDNQVVIQGDRLDPFYENVPGQWGTIWLRAGSKDNQINHALIKNSVIGILMDSVGGGPDPTLLIQNTQIYNTSNFGLYGRSTHILGTNLVIGNNGQSSLACVLGGIYEFTHATFANYWSKGIRGLPAVIVSDQELSEGGISAVKSLANDLLATFTNCIIEGNQSVEFLLQNNESGQFDFNFRNNLLRFMDTGGNYANDPLYDFQDVSHYQDNIINGEPDFKDVLRSDFIIGQDSDANGNADKLAAKKIPFDILGVNRLSAPDIGAYQHIEFEE